MLVFPARLAPPVVEVVTLPGSGGTYDVTTIGGIVITGNFSMILGTITGLNVSGSPTILGLRLSTDAGSSFDSSSIYKSNYFSGSEANAWTTRTSGYIHTGLAATGNEVVFCLYDVNTAGFPVFCESAELTPVSDGTQKQYNWFYNQFSAVDAFQLFLADGTAPQMTAGTLRVMGFR